MSDALTVQIERCNEEVRARLREQLRSMPPAEFEALVGRLLTKAGFVDVAVTGRTGDGGVDVRGTMVAADVVRIRMAVQVKRWKQNVHSPVVRQVRGSLGTHEHGLIITTGDFSRGARDEAERGDTTPVALMDGAQLVNLLIQHEVGVHRRTEQVLELAPPK